MKNPIPEGRYLKLYRHLHTFANRLWTIHLLLNLCLILLLLSPEMINNLTRTVILNR